MSINNRMNSYFLIQLHNRIKQQLPEYVAKSLYKTIPVSFLLSIIEVLSLSSLFPIINMIIHQEQIRENRILWFIYQNFGFSTNARFILAMLMLVIVLFILKNIAVFYFSKFQITTFYKTAEMLVLEKYRFYMNMPYSQHVDSNSSALLRNVSQIPYEFVNGVLMPFSGVITEILAILLLAVSILIYNPLLFISLVGVLFPLVYLYNKLHKKKLEDLSKKRDSESLNLYKQVSQSFEGIREFIIFDKKEYFFKTLKTTVSNFTKINSDAFLISYISPKIVETVAVFAIFMVFFIGFIQGQAVDKIASVLVLYSIALYRLIPSINKILLSLNNIRICDYTFQYMKVEQEIHFADSDSLTEIKFENKISVENVSFKYPGADKLILEEINLDIKKGSTVGIIGPSGSGKSTLLNIFLRLFEENSGSVLVDEEKISKKNVKALYKLMGYVPQNITIIEGSLLENIAFGVERNLVDENLLKNVIQKAQLSAFFKELPEGLNTQLGERGVKISGGQKQRIGIARALYHRAQILIFDEATSALDYETEEALTESIRSISHKEITIVIVAHRLQTLKYCDYIYKLKDGKLDTRAFNYEEIISERT